MSVPACGMQRYRACPVTGRLTAIRRVVVLVRLVGTICRSATAYSQLRTLYEAGPLHYPARPQGAVQAGCSCSIGETDPAPTSGRQNPSAYGLQHNRVTEKRLHRRVVPKSGLT